MINCYKRIDVEHYDNEAIVNHPDVQELLTRKEFERNWNLQLFDLKSCLPRFYEWCEDYFESKITVTRFFITLPNSSTVVHEDAGYKMALNIPIINCGYSKNVWYHVNKNQKRDVSVKPDGNTMKYAANDGKAFTWPHDAIIQPINELELKGPTLFNTSIPHNVIAVDCGHPRIALSIRTESMKK